MRTRTLPVAATAVTPATFQRLATSRRGELLLQAILGNLSLAIDEHGHSCVVIVFPGSCDGWSAEYGGLRAKVHPRATVVDAGRREERSVGVLACLIPEQLDRFSVLANDVHERVARDRDAVSSAPRFRELVTEWASLFEPRPGLTTQKVLGLWGELIVLLQMPNVDDAIAAWYGPEAKTFDFGGRGEYLEVKTSTQGHLHRFSLDQVIAPLGTRIHIASLHVREDPAGGRTIEDLAAEVRTRARAVVAFEKKLLRLGVMPERNGERYSTRTLKFVNASDVPRPREVDDGVTEVRFSASLEPVAAVPARGVSTVLRRICGHA